jgi:hypothetical protein
MQRRVLGFLAAAVFMAVSASPALADAGAPGTTFPEQPGNNAETACVAVTTNPGSGVGGSTEGHISPTAAAITGGLIVDACFGG